MTKRAENKIKEKNKTFLILFQSTKYAKLTKYCKTKKEYNDVVRNTSSISRRRLVERFETECTACFAGNVWSAAKVETSTLARCHPER